MAEPLIDDTAICPACDGSGFGVADTQCGFCGGCGGVPMVIAQQYYGLWEPLSPTPSIDPGLSGKEK